MAEVRLHVHLPFSSTQFIAIPQTAAVTAAASASTPEDGEKKKKRPWAHTVRVYQQIPLDSDGRDLPAVPDWNSDFFFSRKSEDADRNWRIDGAEHG
jgi:hypothetical protein